jgi:hypothetical protein
MAQLGHVANLHLKMFSLVLKSCENNRKSVIKMSAIQVGYKSTWSEGWSRTKQANHCRLMAYDRQCMLHRVPQLPYQEANPMRVALAVMLMGTGFDDALMFMAINDIPTPPVNQLYQAQKVVCEEIINFANESCEQARAETPNGTVISFDGAWEHRRNAARCMLSVISQQTRKVLSWMVVAEGSAILTADSARCRRIWRFMPSTWSFLN